MAHLVDSDLGESASEVLLASQWREPSTAQFLDVPERRLLVAVLVDAVRILFGKNQRQRAGVLRWIKGDAARIPFRELCHNLELDPEATARKLIQSAAKRRDDGRRVSTRRVACIGRRTAVRDRQQPAAAGHSSQHAAKTDHLAPIALASHEAA